MVHDDRHPAETLSSICMASALLDEHYADELRVGVVLKRKYLQSLLHLLRFLFFL